MRRPRLVTTAVLGGLATALLLAGCASFIQTRETVLPDVTDSISSPTPSGSASIGVATERDCAGADATFAGDGITVVVTGTCPNVSVQGHQVEVDLTRATVYVLTVSGDETTVEAGEVAGLEVTGQQNSVAVASAQSLAVYGNGNNIDATGELAKITVGGASNTILGGSIGSVDSQGDGNTIRARH